ncbi:MAG: YigZ family protein [Bacteroidales bacterium]|nr:YigZ family protein [Bacteroidales bacterium]
MESKTKPTGDCYKSISALSKGIYKDNGSKFLAFAFPVETELEIKSIITEIKKEYFDARHHCYAYRLGYLGDIWRLNDDGEPSSTAGKPIFGQLLSNELSDILVIVIRYFGGIKLGVPGLIKAYKSATADAIANAEIINKIAGEYFTVSFEYQQMNDVMKVLKNLNINPISQISDALCSIEVRVRLTQIEQFKELLKNTHICQKA